MANTFLTYLLWLPFGLFGLHHIYLGRYEQAIVYGQTLGLFGMGYVLDFFYIPQYVHDINLRSIHKKEEDKSETEAVPKSCSSFISFGIFTALRFGVTFGISYLYAFLTELVWIYSDDDSRFLEPLNNRIFAYLILSVAAAYGARLVGNVGHSYSSYRLAFGGAFVGLVLESLFGGPDSEGIPAAVAASCGATVVTFFTRRTLSKPLPRVTFRRSSPVCCCCYRKGDNGCCSTLSTILVFWLLLPLLLILHADLHVNKEGFIDSKGLSSMKLGSYVYNHPEESWRQLSEFWEELQKYKAQRGWDGMRNDIYEMWVDDDDYEVLGLNKNTATLTDVKRAYREKAKLWHPDRLPRDATPSQRDKAIDKFRKVEKAYSQLCKSLGGKKGCHGRDGGDRSGSNDNSNDDAYVYEEETVTKNNGGRGRSSTSSGSSSNRRNRRNRDDDL